MKLNKPFMKVIKTAFGFSTKEVRAYLHLCETNPAMARGLAGEYGKLWVYESMFGKLICEVNDGQERTN